jgi:hypothetical protein
MFLVSDDIDTRHNKIIIFLDNEDAPIAILLAAADFERCVRRAILGLGASPTAYIKAKIMSNGFHGLRAFKRAWKHEVSPHFSSSLDKDVVTSWDEFSKAYQFRHKIIHGIVGRFSPDYASTMARRLLQASREIHVFAADRGVNLDRPIRRLKTRSLLTCP